jgi:hypothetical protein
MGSDSCGEVDLPRPFLTYPFLGQEVAADAAALILMTAVLSRSLTKYADRDYRYLWLEAGHRTLSRSE